MLYTLSTGLVLETAFELTREMLTALGDALLLAQDRLRLFSKDTEFAEKVSVAFGESADASRLQLDWLEGNFEIFAGVEVRASAELNGALGAYAASLDTIYLSQELLATGDVEQIISVWLEEAGHRVDAQINVADSTGDEGEIFARVVQGEVLSETELYRLKSKEDETTVILDSQVIQIEQAHVNELEPNDFPGNAQFLAPSNFTRDFDAGIQDLSGNNISTTYYHATINGTGDFTNDFYRFSAHAGSTIILDVDDNTFPAALYLYDLNGSFLVRYDSFPPSEPGHTGSPNSSFITFTAPYTGDFIVGVGSYNGPPVPGGTSYELNISLSEQPQLNELEPNNSPRGAQFIAPSNFTRDFDAGIQDLSGNNISTTYYHATINGTGDSTGDFYRFGAYAGSTIILDVDDNTFPAGLFLYDSNGGLLTRHEFFPPTEPGHTGSPESSFITFTAPYTGDFIVGVGFYGGGTVPSGNSYELNISLSEQSQLNELEPNDFLGDAQFIDSLNFTRDFDAGIQDLSGNNISTTYYHATINASGDNTRDFYRFRALAGSTIILDVDDNTFPAGLFLYDSNGSLADQICTSFLVLNQDIQVLQSLLLLHLLHHIRVTLLLKLDSMAGGLYLAVLRMN